MAGSGDYISLVLHRIDATNVEDYEEVGYIAIQFSSPLKYYVHHCYDSQEWVLVRFPTPPPAEKNKIWTITKTFTNLVIDCNGVRVLNLNFKQHFRPKCASKWSQDVARIVFFNNGEGDEDDNASDMYRIIPKCDSLPNIAHLGNKSGKLPVNQGTEVTVKCSEGYILGGDSVITCQQEQEFTGNPLCLKIGMRHNL